MYVTTSISNFRVQTSNDNNDINAPRGAMDALFAGNPWVEELENRFKAGHELVLRMRQAPAEPGYPSNVTFVTRASTKKPGG